MTRTEHNIDHFVNLEKCSAKQPKEWLLGTRAVAVRNKLR